MKIVFTGGGTGGHFYPLIAVAEELNKFIKERNINNAKLYYISPTPYDVEILKKNNLIYKKISTGKSRSYGDSHSIFDSIKNFFDYFKTFFGILKSIVVMFSIYPDVVFAKGGYGSFPVLFAARILLIPAIIHESDTVPGRVNKWAGKFAKKIAISFPQTVKYFKEEKVAHTGQPIRRSVKKPLPHGAYEYLRLEKDIPIILVLGGSQGSLIINKIILKSLISLTEKYQIIHQVGEGHIDNVKKISEDILQENPYKERYKPFGFLNDEAMEMAAGVSSFVVSRAGSTIFEIAAWQLPSIIIPITHSVNNHQFENAYAYARSGSCKVIEEKNLSPEILVSEINELIENNTEREEMINSTKEFHKDDSAEKIAKEILKISLKHEQI